MSTPAKDTTPDIEHLDFDVEEKKRHYSHPIDPDIFWCGELKPVQWRGIQPGLSKRTTDASTVTCVDCLHLFIKKSGKWWWEVNRAWYGE